MTCVQPCGQLIFFAGHTMFEHLGEFAPIFDWTTLQKATEIEFDLPRRHCTSSLSFGCIHAVHYCVNNNPFAAKDSLHLEIELLQLY